MGKAKARRITVFYEELMWAEVSREYYTQCSQPLWNRNDMQCRYGDYKAQ